MAPADTPTDTPATALGARGTLQCFKPGRHTAVSGATLSFTAEDVAATARAYDPALHEAPIVVGHPALDAPAYGWVKQLAFEGGALEATPAQVNAEFAEAVRAGAYKKMSAAFWAPDAPGNPVPGVFYLRHIGFLGGAAPAVKGLRAPAFAAGEAGVVEFSDWDAGNLAWLLRSLRDWLLGKFGQDEADRALPTYLVGEFEQSAARAAAQREAGAATSTAPAAPLFGAAGAAPTPALEDHDVAERETQAALSALEAAKAENARLREQLAQAATTARAQRLAGIRAEDVAYADSLVAAGRLPVGRRDVVVAVFDALAVAAEADAQTAQFGEGEARAPLRPALKELLTKLLPVQVAPGRHATHQFAAAGEAGEPAGDAHDIARRATEYRASEAAAGRTVGAAQAVAHVTRAPAPGA
jgi:hypothetical protein